jgi:hypothetical protein
LANYIEISKRKSPNFNIKTFAIILGVFGLLLTIYIAYRASISDRKLFSVSLLALFAGLLFESFRVSDSWKNVIYIFIGTYFFSLLCFFPGKNEKIYNFENHIEAWPYFFIVFFALVFAIINKDKVTAKLSEGITLLLSLSLIYWIIDYGFINYQNWFAITILTIIFILSAFSILNALKNIQLSRSTRLILSVWSTIIMFAFAIDNIIKVFSNQDIESTSFLSQGLYIGLQYFFLGISAVYIMQNYILLVLFLPDKSGNYKNDLKEIKKDHIARYSDNQVSTGSSLFCIFYACILLGMNYKYQVLPRNTMIWLVLLTFPLIIQLIAFINSRKNYSQ